MQKQKENREGGDGLGRKGGKAKEGDAEQVWTARKQEGK